MKKLMSTLLVLTLLFSAFVPTYAEEVDNSFKLGVEVLLSEKKHLIEGKKVGLITNPTGVDQKLNHIVDLLDEDDDIDLVALYGPEHGVRGDAQAGSQVESYIDEQTGIIVHSLYGSTKKPTPEMLEGVDVLIFDIQDVGARFYTYIYTMAYAMQAAQENDIEMIVLDRPNPLGGHAVDGPILEEEYSSFVGMYPIPVMHGMTVGELAYYFNTEFDIQSDLTVVPMKNWHRDLLYDDLGLELVLPSPNMPTTKSIQVYPGAGFFEGTNMSEGRGTTKPFELIGAPFVNAYDFAKAMNSKGLPGVRFRAASFTPTMSKHKGELSHGVQIHVLDERVYEPLRTGLEMIITLNEMYPEDFKFTPNWNNTSYFFDTLMGNSWVREAILEGKTYNEIEAMWTEGLNEFKENRRQYLIYDNGLDKSEVLEQIKEMKEIDDSLYTEESIIEYEKAIEEIETELEEVLTIRELKQLKDTLSDLEDILELKTEKPGTEKPGTEKPGTEKPGTEKPGTEKPGTEKPGTEKPGTEKPGTEKPGTEKPGTEKPGTEKPGTEKPGTDKPGTEKPGTEKPGVEKPGAESAELDKEELENNIKISEELDLSGFEDDVNKDRFLKALEEARYSKNHAKTQAEIDLANKELVESRKNLVSKSKDLPQTGMSFISSVSLLGLGLVISGYHLKNKRN